VGEYRTDDVLFTHAWPDWHDVSAHRRWSEGPQSRSAYIYSFRTPPFSREIGARRPDYAGAGDLVRDYCCVLFGKRFEHHGLIEGSGMFFLPTFSGYDGLCIHTLPHNTHKSRVDYPVELNLGELSRIENLVQFNDIDERFLRYFRTAVKFYAQALRCWEGDPETAYLNLITAGEVLSNYFVYPKETLLDGATSRILQEVRTHVPEGKKVARQLATRFQGIKKKFVLTILRLIPEGFFDRTETLTEHSALKEISFERAVAAAYDLRSVHLHSGAAFGTWVSRFCIAGNEELQGGRPVVEDRSLGKALADAPTLVGLERVIRCCLLSFAAEHREFRP